MNLTVDYGNTRIKVGVFDGHELREKYVFSEEGALMHFFEDRKFNHAIVSLTKVPNIDIFSHITVSGKKKEIKDGLSLPFQIRYATPHTLGSDRIALVCGGVSITKQKKNCLIVDMGTCIKFDFVDMRGNYLGGAISPGVQMRFRAMHAFVPTLPSLVPCGEALLIGSETQECMQSGVLNGTLAEIDGIINRYKSTYSGLKVFFSGGDSVLFEKRTIHDVSIRPDLALEGLNNVLLHNI